MYLLFTASAQHLGHLLPRFIVPTARFRSVMSRDIPDGRTYFRVRPFVVSGVAARSQLLHRLLEPFDLALGRWVPWPRVLLVNVEAPQFGLECVAAVGPADSGESGGEDHAVVRERGGWDSMGCHRVLESGEHDRGGDRAARCDA